MGRHCQQRAPQPVEQGAHRIPGNRSATGQLQPHNQCLECCNQSLRKINHICHKQYGPHNLTCRHTPEWYRAGYLAHLPESSRRLSLRGQSQVLEESLFQLANPAPVESNTSSDAVEGSKADRQTISTMGLSRHCHTTRPVSGLNTRCYG